ncbi:MAG TPA: PP0621 family protein [Burkholderiales bacterium]|nr:PP0621 family protein [Burkholderiales bacterium]
MGRVLILVLIVVLAVWLIRRALRPAAGKPAQQSKPSLEGELVSCARCGLNLPRGEAREARGALYCSDEHARLGQG